MSSILKAMRQANTQAPQAAVTGYRRQEAPSANSGSLAVAGVICVAALAGWLLAPYMGLLNEDQTQDNAAEPALNKINFAAPSSIELTALPAPEPEPTAEAVNASEYVPETRNAVQNIEPSSSDALDLDSVSPELLAAFENAVAATADMSTGARQSESVLPLLTDLSSRFKNDVPQFSYEAHNYVSANARRFVVFNGQRLQEGDYFDALQVVRIEPQHVVLALQRQAFRQNALEDWTGTR